MAPSRKLHTMWARLTAWYASAGCGGAIQMMAERCASSCGETIRTSFCSAHLSTGSCSARVGVGMWSRPVLRDALDAVHHEDRAVGAARRAEAVQIGAIAVRELHERHREHAHARVVQPLDQIVFVRPAFRAAGSELDVDPLLPEPQPGIHVRGELAIRNEHDVR